jgi:kynurenine formamidase
MIKKKIKLGSQNFLVIDLTLPLSLNQEVYPGDSKPLRKIFTSMEETGIQHYIHEIGDHHFHPHGDAPNHQNPDRMDQGIEVFDIDYSFNPALMIDLTNNPAATTINGITFLKEITKEHLLPFASLLAEKGAVLFRTGYDKWVENNYPHKVELLPYFNEEAAKYLASFENIKVIGTDSLTVDPDGIQTAHRLFKDKFIVESLVHLYVIPEENHNRFDLQTSPVRIVGATGGPVTAYAFVEI